MQQQRAVGLFDAPADRLRDEAGLLRVALSDLDGDAESGAVLDDAALEALIDQRRGDRRSLGGDLVQQSGPEHVVV